MLGAIESMVKLIKRALKTIIKEKPFTNYALYTIMTEVESTFNSRPLTLKCLVSTKRSHILKIPAAESCRFV